MKTGLLVALVLSLVSSEHFFRIDNAEFDFVWIQTFQTIDRFIEFACEIFVHLVGRIPR